MNKILIGTLLLAALPAWADDSSEALQQARNQFWELQQHTQQRWLSQHQHQTTNQQAISEDLSHICLDYQRVRFVGITLIDPTPFTPQAGECLNEQRLNQLSRDLTAAYLAAGYVHNPLQFEDDHSGALTVHVFEGRIAKLESPDNGFRINQLMPNALGQPLRIQDLDQALDQANRIVGNKVSVDVLPAKNGEIALAFDNQRSIPISASLALDNFASKTYDRFQSKANIVLGNPFGLSDVLYLNLATTLKSRHKFSRSALLYYSLPYGYWTFNSFISLSQFKTQLPLQSLSLQQKGRTVQAGLSIERVIHRGENHISTASLQIERIDGKNRLAGEVLELQSPKLTSVSLGLNHLQLFNGASLVADLRYERSKDTATEPLQRYFSRWNGELKFDRYQAIGKQLFRHTHQLTGQYSRDYLPSVKQEDLTSRYRVRGLNDYSTSAEKNLVLHNNLAWVKEINDLTISPYLGFDVGIQRSTVADSHSEKALAYAVGFNLQQSRWQLNLEWANGRLFTPTQGVKQQRLWLFNLSYKF